MIIKKLNNQEVIEWVSSGRAGMVSTSKYKDVHKEYIVIGVPVGENGEYHSFLVQNREGLFEKVGGFVKFTGTDEFINDLNNVYGYDVE